MTAVLAPRLVVVTLGPDGLVANLARCLNVQVVTGITPDRPGVLARHSPAALPGLLRDLAAGRVHIEHRRTVEARLDDGRYVRGLNDVYVGDPGHRSARDLLRTPDGPGELQSSSGVVIGTGTGATGWCASLAHARPPAAPDPEDDATCWYVREAWPSATTGTTLPAVRLTGDEQLELAVRSDHLVVFGDGGERDRLGATRGQRVTIGAARTRLRLVGVRR
ncbi:MAG: hypothetical protein AB7J32_18930 [Pseudonocardia sp.]